MTESGIHVVAFRRSGVTPNIMLEEAVPAGSKGFTVHVGNLQGLGSLDY